MGTDTGPARNFLDQLDIGHISGSTDRYQRIAIKTAENGGKQKTCDLCFEAQELQPLFNSNTGGHHNFIT